MIYFDNSATSFYKPEIVKNTVIEAMDKYTANAGRSGHKPAQNVAEKIYLTREMLKNFFHAEDFEVVFTKNCTEALNLAILGSLKLGDHVIITMFEHNSVLRTLEKAKSFGVEVDIIDCSLRDFHKTVISRIKQNTKMLISTAVSNVTGDASDIKQLGEICHKNNIIFLVDGAQSSGHKEIDLKDSQVDMYAFSGHKGLLSLTGVGGLMLKKGTQLNPIIYGGTGTESENLNQPRDFPEGFESGTLPIVPILSLGAGLQYLQKNKIQIFQKEENLGWYLFSQLIKLPNIICYFDDGNRTVFSINVKKYDSGYVANFLNENYNICVRAGLHCAPMAHKFLGTLQLGGTVRISIDFFNSFEEIDVLISALKELC